MAVYVGSARSDENGGAHSGKAGDQKNGKEVSTQKWYRHSKGWRVFRAKDPAVRDKIADAMEAACNNNKIGYDQWQRHTLYKAAKKVGFDISKVTTACETDCSALVRTCLAYAGIKGIPESFRTYNMPSAMLKTGKIAELKGSKYSDQSTYLGRGDILVTPVSGHTVVVLDNGAKYEPGAVPPPKEYKFGERILRNGDEGKDVMQLQSYLVDLGYDLGDFGNNRDGIDGDFGDATEIAVEKFQKAHGCDPDGEYGPITHAALMKAIEEKRKAEIVVVTPKQVKIEGGDCWMRKEPIVNAENKITAIKCNTVLEYQNETSENGWLKVKYKEQIGWVSNKYGKLI